MRLDRIPEWPYPRNLRSIEDVNEHLKKLYLALEEDSVLRIEEMDITVEGEHNTLLGIDAGYSLTTGTYNTLLGRNAGYSITTGLNNTVVGRDSLYTLISGFSNVAVGWKALYATTASYNTAGGVGALFADSTGDYNTAFGYLALTERTEGRYNTGIGHSAGNMGTTGNENVYVGDGAGFSHTGDGSVFIGYRAGYNETGDNKLYIDNSLTTTPLIYGEFDNDFIRINGYFEVVQNSDTITLSHDGTDAYVKWSDGSLVLQTDEGTNVDTIINLKPKGTSNVSSLYLYDANSSALNLWTTSNTGNISSGSGGLNFQNTVAYDIKLWPTITAGSPYFYIYGFKTADAVRYGRLSVQADGDFHIQSENDTIFDLTGGDMAFRTASTDTDNAGLIKVAKVTVTAATLTNAGAADTANLLNLPAGSVLLSAKYVLDVQFSGGSVSDVDLTIGLAGDNTGLVNPAAHNLTSDTVGTEYVTRGAYWSATTAAGYHAATATQWIAYFTAVGDTWDNITGGQITGYFMYIDFQGT